MLWTTVMAWGLEEKKKNVKGDRCESVKDFPIAKLVFSL